MKYSIVIPTYNHCDDLLKPCINSILEFTDFNDQFELIVVANGCKDNTKYYLDNELSGINLKTIWFDDPIGFTKATNAGIQAVDKNTEYIILINNDAQILPYQEKNKWIEWLEQPFKDFPNQVAITGPSKRIDPVTKRIFIIFYMVMIPKKIFDEIGLLDEIFSPGFGEDIDFAIKCQNSGYKIIQVPDDNFAEITYFPVWHQAEKTMHSDDVEWEKLGKEKKWDDITERNRGILKQRYDHSLKKKINIIIPTFKRNVLLLRIFDNLKQQTFSDFKVWICSDGYDSYTEKLCKIHLATIDYEYLFTNFTIDFGVSQRIKILDLLPENEYVCFLDDDNIIYSNYLEKLITAIEDHDIAYCNIQYFNRFSGDTFKIIPGTEVSIPIKGEIDSLNFLLTTNLAIKNKHIWKTDSYNHDYNFALECWKDAKTIFVNEILGVHPYESRFNYVNILIPQDRQLFDTIIKANEYVLDEEQLQNKTIVDIGGNIGFFTALTLQMGAKKSIIVDPISNNIIKLKELFDHDERVTILQNAVTDKSNEIVYLSDGGAGGQVIKTKTEFETTTITLQEIVDNHIDPADQNLVLKLDCEGSEFPILLTSPVELIRKFEFIHIEIHVLNEEHSFKLLEEQIEKTFGFKCINRVQYYTWIEMPDGSKLNFTISAVAVYKYERIPEEIFQTNLNLIKTLPMKYEYRYSIVIPTYNRCDELLKPCIESIIKFTDLSDVEVIVVANGCVDNTKEYVESLGSPFKLIFESNQLGYTKAMNLGLKAAKGEYIVFLNNDIQLLDSEKNAWLDYLREPIEKYEKVGMTGPIKFEGIEGESNDFIMFFCAMISKKVMDEIGLLDERFSPGGVEDVDYGLRLILAGYQLIQVPYGVTLTHTDNGFNIATFPIFHPGGSTVRLEKDWDKVLVRNNKLLMEKFPDHFKGIRWIDEHKDYKIYDCFPFFNELELLEIRLEELYDTVDYFILTEARYTHSGNPKPLYYFENKDRFTKYNDKIIHEVVNLNSWPCDPWDRERTQRDAALNVLKRLDVRDKDYVIISDIDEIPRSESILEHTRNETEKVGVLKQDRFMFFFNYINVTTDEPQLNSKIVKYKILKNSSPCNIRYCDKYNEIPYYIIENAGWHFTFMGGVDKVIEKVKSFAHQEYNTPEKLNYERISKLIDEGKDVYSANTTWKIISIDDSFPKLIIKDKDKWEKLGWIRNKNEYLKTINKSKDIIENTKKIEKMKHQLTTKKLTVTASLSTRKRYFDTLPACLIAIANQTIPPNELLIFDDTPEKERVNLQVEPLYQNIFSLLQRKKINWHFLFARGEGQVLNHQATIGISKCDLIWRMDDDNAPEPNVLETLIKSFEDPNVAAVAGLVVDPKSPDQPNPKASSKIEDIFLGLNIQWFPHIDNKIKEVDHLYSSFIYRKEFAKHGYNMMLSRVGHREETMFTYQMKLDGYKILVDPNCITWHFNNPSGGIRDNTKEDMWRHDESIFRTFLDKSKIKANDVFYAVLDSGLGDHFAFSTILPKLKEKYKNKKIVLAVCFPEIFKNDKDIELISIADAWTMFGNLDRWHIYKWMAERDWKKHIIEAFQQMYELD